MNNKNGIIKVSSVERLAFHKYDPIGKLVELARTIEKEIQFQLDLRDGTTVRIRPDGKPMMYSARTHMELFAGLQKINSELLRYGYARVPEVNEAPKPPAQPLLVKLHDRATPFKIGGSDVVDDADFEVITDD